MAPTILREHIRQVVVSPVEDLATYMAYQTNDPGNKDDGRVLLPVGYEHTE